MTKEELLEKWSKENKVLDQGYVQLLDVMGDDRAIEEGARTSYQAGTRSVSDTRALIRYLVANRHTTPVEMCELKVRVKLPIFVERQWIRHRMSTTNEMSARYSILPEEWYTPEPDQICYQSTDNKQGRSGPVPAEYAAEWIEDYDYRCQDAFDSYNAALNDDGSGNLADPEKPNLARETARMGLPLSTYTVKIWKIDAHNLMHFMHLRMDPHAQWEVREYANIIADIVKDWMPLLWEAFVDYRLEAVTFSRNEMVVLRTILEKYAFDNPNALHRSALPSLLLAAGCTKREVGAFLKKTGLVLHGRTDENP